MPRIIILVAAVFGVCTLVDARLAQASEGPWCAFISVGNSSVHEDCHYKSFAECQPNVLAGNRGFCNQNPRWAGWYGPVGEPRVRHKRQARKH